TANFTRSTRSVALDRGEAHFNVAKDPKRPFQVSAGVGTVTAVGTAFNVQRRQDAHVVVTVTEGIVEVAPISKDAESGGEASSTEERPDVLRVSRGEEVSYDAQGRSTPIRVAEVTAAIAWRDG